jgi:hypothetical protein
MARALKADTVVERIGGGTLKLRKGTVLTYSQGSDDRRKASIWETPDGTWVRVRGSAFAPGQVGEARTRNGYHTHPAFPYSHPAARHHRR